LGGPEGCQRPRDDRRNPGVVASFWAEAFPRYCGRPPFALERLSLIRDADDLPAIGIHSL
jgi:hypothetical protein